jgi:predicted dithiol-disulfide oxidoreductase (DUF899 family)
VANVFTVKGGGFIFTIVGGHSYIFRSRLCLSLSNLVRGDSRMLIKSVLHKTNATRMCTQCMHLIYRVNGRVARN